MSQSTEQKGRAGQIKVLSDLFMMAGFPPVPARKLGEVAVSEAEARGAEEQRRKDAKTERRFRHVERGTEYRLIGNGNIQQNGPYDMAKVVIYQDVNDGSFWVRSPSEFYDGRFRELFPEGAAMDAEERV